MNKQFDILVIDDEQVIIDAVNKICSAEGFKVDTSIDAKDALEKLSKYSYKIIVCDIMMPDYDGFEFLGEIIRRKITSPVIMTTGYSTVENAVMSLYKGAIDFIPKPFTADEILNSIIRAMKYSEVQKMLLASHIQEDDATIIYVPCPAKYYRLGYASWAAEENAGSILIGVTDLFLKTIEGVEEIEFQKIDEEIIQGNQCAAIKSKDGLLHNVLSPVTGRIIERNEEVLKDVNLLEKDPYFNGWFYRVIPSESEYELKHLIPCSSDRL
ncbi:MAG TPA: response regulator [Ignavibacteriaceae bacterium]|nr:response regulator [Ignavibacteriaceae bacterium]